MELSRVNSAMRTPVFIATVSCVVAAACREPEPASPQSVAASPHWEEIAEAAVQREGRGDPRPYPTLFPILSDEELSRRTLELENATSGWSIVLDPFGFVHEVTCATCGVTTDSAPLSASDREMTFQFLDEHEEAFGWKKNDRYVEEDLATLVTFSSLRAGASRSTIISHRRGKLGIRGHAWPDLPKTQTMDPDLLKEKLRAIYSGSDVTYDLKRIHFVAPTDAGPLEVRQAACWMSVNDDYRERARRVVGGGAARPCVDARTGDDLTGLEIAWSIETKDGKVARRVFRPTPPAVGGYQP
jgi:hypothetical protein